MPRLERQMRRAVSSGAFRFAVAMALVFAVGAAALLAVVNHAIDHYTADAVADAVQSETAILLGEERQLGRAELVNAVRRHEAAMVESHLRYVLVDRAGHVLVGGLPASVARNGWRELRLRTCARGRGCVVPLLAHGTALGDGALLVVASDTTDLVRLRRELSGFTERMGVGIALLVLLGGFATSGIFLRRLDRVNASIGRIVAGRFAERLPSIGMGPEFDELSTNLNAMLDRIETLMEGLRQVSTDVAHDLRTPLTRLRQRLERLRDRVGPGVAEEVEAALAQTDGILAVFSALLRIGAMESGRARALLAPVDLSELLERIGDAYRPEIEDGGRRLLVAVTDGMTVEGDRELLGQAVANLVENAMKHTPPGATIRLVAAGRAGRVSVSVEDDGVGVPVEERERVLRRFYRLDRSRGTPGAGLGLPLVAAIAALHDGTLSLEDASPGLRATLVLPAT
jgi:signal transduction histidine kinase